MEAAIALTALRRFMAFSRLKDSPGDLPGLHGEDGKGGVCFEISFAFRPDSRGLCQAGALTLIRLSRPTTRSTSPSEARRELMARWTEPRSAPGVVPMSVAASFAVSSRSFNNSIALCWSGERRLIASLKAFESP
jgi:hypothetical protein